MFNRGANLRLHAWNLLQNLLDMHLHAGRKPPDLQQLEEEGACSDHCSQSPDGLRRALVSVHPSLGFLRVKCLWITTNRAAGMDPLCTHCHQGCGEDNRLLCWCSAPGKHSHSAGVSAATHAEVVCVHRGNFRERGREPKETSHVISSTQREQLPVICSTDEGGTITGQQNYQQAWIVVSH